VGARRLADVTTELRVQIESGDANTATHIEQMAVSFSALMAAVEPDLADVAVVLDDLPFIQRYRRAGALLLEKYGEAAYAHWPRADRNDIYRGWQAFAIAAAGLDVGNAFAAAIPFAADPHFGVREWAWLAVRDHVVAEPAEAVCVATRLSQEATAGGFHVRFAVEATRPRSVWGRHVLLYKREPELGENLLRVALGRPEQYPATAAVNWIADAASTRPDWARKFADQSRETVGSASTGRALDRLMHRVVRASE
jgi:hypothetical protein